MHVLHLYCLRGKTAVILFGHGAYSKIYVSLNPFNTLIMLNASFPLSFNWKVLDWYGFSLKPKLNGKLSVSTENQRQITRFCHSK